MNHKPELQLFDYQEVGVRWLVSSWIDGSRNVMLADEMGLGKTMQSIGLIKEMMQKFKITRPFLIAVPLSTIENWRRELKLWCPEAKVVVYYGKGKSRDLLQKTEFFFNVESHSGETMRVPSFNVMLTSFDYLRSDFHTFGKIEWQVFIIDEGQKMKNNNSTFFKKCSAIKT